MAYDQIHVVDVTSQMIEIALRSSSTGQLLTGKAYGDMTVKYQREGAAAATTVSVVTATKGSYTSGGFVETDIAGIYQFGIPAGALATGAKAVTITFACTGALDVVKRIVLIGADLRNANSLGLAYLTGDAYARLGAPAGASVSADVLQIKNYVDDIGTAGAGLTALPWNAAWDAEVQSEVTDALNAYDPPTDAELIARTLPSASYFDPAADVVAHVTLVDTVTTLTNMPAAAPTAADNADAVWDELLAGHAGAGSAGLALSTASSGGVDPSVLADAVWDEALSGHSTAGTTGKKLTDLVNADLSGVATQASVNDLPTVAEFEARTLLAADYTVVSDLPSVPSAADIKTALEVDGGKLDHLWEMTEDDGGVRRLTTNALEQAPTGGAAPSATTIADAVWDEALSGHVIVGSAGAGLSAAGSAGDPWSTTLPGAYTGDQAGAILDSIRDVTNAIDTSAVTTVTANDAGVLTIVNAVTFGTTVSGLTISATWTKIYWTLKESIYDDDSEAIIQIVESNPGAGTDGLLYLDSAAIASPITVADGTLTVNQSGGTVVIAVSDNATALLSAASELVWDIKTKDAAGATVQNATGTASIVRAVTQTI